MIKSENNSYPHSLKAEAALIGSCILDPSITSGIQLKPHMFFAKVHELIWQEILYAESSGKPWDAVTLGNQIKDAGLLDATGGYSYLIEVQDIAAVPAHSQHYEKIIHEKYQLRKLIEITMSGAEAAMNEEDVDEISSRVMSDLAAEIVPDEEDLEMHEYSERFLEDCENSVAGTVNWWCTEWDEYLGKLDEELVILHAPRSTGKTAMMLQWIIEGHRSGARLPLCSIEMLKKKIAVRFQQYMGQINPRLMKTRRPTQDEKRRAKIATEEMKVLKFCVKDKEMTVDDIRAYAIKHSKKGIDAIFIDNLLCISEGNKNFASKTAMYDYFIKKLRDLRDTLKIPVILLAHPNSEGGIAWSKDVENIADIIVYLKTVPDGGLDLGGGIEIDKRSDVCGKHILAKFQKNRDGICPMAHLDFVGEFQTFRHLSWQD